MLTYCKILVYMQWKKVLIFSLCFQKVGAQLKLQPITCQTLAQSKKYIYIIAAAKSPAWRMALFPTPSWPSKVVWWLIPEAACWCVSPGPCGLELYASARLFGGAACRPEQVSVGLQLNTFFLQGDLTDTATGRVEIPELSQRVCVPILCSGPLPLQYIWL